MLRAIAQPDWGEAWAADGDGFAFIPANRYFDLSVYESETGRRIAETTISALERGGFRFDGSDLMPPEIGLEGAFLDGMVRYFQEGPDSLEGIMADVEAAWVALESES